MTGYQYTPRNGCRATAPTVSILEKKLSVWNEAYMLGLMVSTVYPKKYAHGFCFAVLCCGYSLTDFPISIRLTSLALWQSNDCPSASKATLMNMDKYFMWIHYERLRNHNKAKHNKTVCKFLGIYCICYCLTELGSQSGVLRLCLSAGVSCYRILRGLCHFQLWEVSAMDVCV